MQAENAEILALVSACAGAVLLCLAWILVPHRWRRVALEIDKQNSQDREDKEDKQIDATPKVSVIAYSNGDSDEVGKWLKSIDEQDYMHKEAMVVILGTKRQCDSLKDIFRCYEWAKFSFIPPDNHNISLRKLAYTLGVKGTEGEIIVTSDTYCRPNSGSWLRCMASWFNDSKCEIVLGYSWLDFSSIKKELISSGCRMDAFVNALKWMSWALVGKPYRGDGNNMAFRRSTFMAHGGYQSTYFLHPGYDDIFVSQVARKGNCQIELREAARVKVEAGKDTVRRWIDKKETDSFTESYLPKTPQVVVNMSSICIWLGTILAILTSILAPSNFIALGIAAASWLGWGTATEAAYRGVVVKFSQSAPKTGIILYSYMRLPADLIFKIIYRKRKKGNYTWQK